MSEQLHTCSYYCERPGCVRAQRDQLRDWMESVSEPLTPEREAKLAEREAACRKMIEWLAHEHARQLEFANLRKSAMGYHVERADKFAAIADELERLIDKVPFLERYIAKLEATP